MRLPPSCVNSAEAGPGEWPNIIVSPSPLIDDDGVHTITVNSTGLVEGCMAMVSTPLLRHFCTFVSPTEVTFDINLAQYAPYGGKGMPVWLMLPDQTRSKVGRLITEQLPTTLTSITPDTASLDDVAADVTIIGTNFTLDWTLQIGNAHVGKTIVSPTEMTASLVLAAVGEGAHAVRLRSSYGPPDSNELTFTVSPSTAPPPTLTAINPSSVAVAAPLTTMTVTGTGITPTATLWVNGALGQMTYVSDTQLTFSLNAAYLGVGTHSVTIRTAGGESNPITFEVTP